MRTHRKTRNQGLTSILMALLLAAAPMAGQEKAAYIGVHLSDVTPESASKLGLKNAAGAEIAQIDPGGPASKSGLKLHDLIVSFNGLPVKNAQQFILYIGQVPPGLQLKLGISRAGQAMTISVQTGERPAAAGQPAAGQNVPEQEGWEIEEITDRMTGKNSLQGIFWELAVGSQTDGKFKVTATCDDDSLNFLIDFFSDSDPKLGFLKHVVPPTLVGHKKPWVDMRVRIDNGEPKAVTSEDDFINEATVSFSTSPRWFNPNYPAGAPGEALKAKSILVELPLANGDKPILELNPQDPSFKQFVARCGVAPAPATEEQPPAPTPEVPSSAREESHEFDHLALPAKLEPVTYTGTS